MEIESRLLPCGLHVIGKPPTAEEASPLWLTSAVLIGRKRKFSACLELLPTASGGILIRFIRKDRGILEDVQLLQDITLTRVAVAALVKAQTDADGRVSKVSKLNFLTWARRSLGLRHCTRQATPR